MELQAWITSFVIINSERSGLLYKESPRTFLEGAWLAANVVEEPVALLGPGELVSHHAQEGPPKQPPGHRLLGHAAHEEVHVVHVGVHLTQSINKLEGRIA